MESSHVGYFPETRVEDIGYEFIFMNSINIIQSFSSNIEHETRPDLVSVVVPAYNAEQYLKQTLESALSQTYRKFEVIVVDDGSTDSTPLIAQQFGDSIRYIRQSNQGLSVARNTAIKNARGEFIALLDADDLWESEFLEKMVHKLKDHPEAAGVYCGFQYINSESEVVGKPSLKVVPPERFHSVMKYDGNWLVPCSVIFRKQLIERVGLFDETFHAVADWDMWIRLSEYGPFDGLQEVLVKYRRHEHNMSKDPVQMIGAIGQLMVKIHDTADGSLSTWPETKKRAFSDYYRGGAIRFFAAGRIQRSIEYLELLAGVAPDYACSLTVWRGFARALIPDEYQFEQFPPHNWKMIEVNYAELFRELDRQVSDSSNLHHINSRLKGFAFLALADEAGRMRELTWACAWLRQAVKIYVRLLFARPFWGTVFRSISVYFSTVQITKSEVKDL